LLRYIGYFRFPVRIRILDIIDADHQTFVDPKRVQRIEAIEAATLTIQASLQM
jgi:hypothetical protein